jgi:hypothetical protein
MERWLGSERNVRICAVLGAVTIAFSSVLVRLSHSSPSTAAIFRCPGFLLLLRHGGSDRRRPARCSTRPRRRPCCA